MGLGHSPRIVTDGLVLCLDAASKRSYPGTGTTWTDLKGGNNGTLTNGPTFDTNNGGSIVFDGSNDSVVTSDFDLDYISIFTWFKPTNFSAYREVVGKWSGGSDGKSYTLLTDLTTGKIRWWINSGGTIVNNNGQLIANEWNSVCATFDGAKSKTYHNGEFVAEISRAGSLASSNTPITIGNRDSNTYPMLGNIALVHIYNRALTADEVRQNYLATKERYA